MNSVTLPSLTLLVTNAQHSESGLSATLHLVGIVGTVGKPLSGASVVGQVEADILGNAF